MAVLLTASSCPLDKLEREIYIVQQITPFCPSGDIAFNCIKKRLSVVILRLDGIHSQQTLKSHMLVPSTLAPAALYR